MKKYIFACIFTITIMLQGMNVFAADIDKIDVYYSSPDLNVKEDIYDTHYTITDTNEIKMFSHYLKTLTTIPGGGRAWDIPMIFFTITYDDNTVTNYTVYKAMSIELSNEDFYKITVPEYYQLCGFINSLILGQFNSQQQVSAVPSSWAEKYIDKSIENGLVPKWNQIGYINNISRVEICQLADNFLEINGVYKEDMDKNTYYRNNNSVFDDTDDIAVNRLYKMGVIDGKSDTEFYPYDEVTREEAAKILSRVCDIVGIKANITTVNYTDKKDISNWAADDVEKMSSIGAFIGDEENKFNPKDNMTKEELITVLLRLNEKPER